jgi:hypothetical protein
MAPELDERVAHRAVERYRIDAHRDGYRDGRNPARWRGPIDPSPTIDQAIDGGFPWLEPAQSASGFGE